MGSIKVFQSTWLCVAWLTGALLALESRSAEAEPAAAAPALALAGSEPAPLRAKERKYVEKLGTAAAEVVDECYPDTENERDPHYAPDWCDQKAAAVAKAVAKSPTLAAEVIAYTAYEHPDGPRSAYFAVSSTPPIKADGRRYWLAFQLERAADRTVLVWRIQQHMERQFAKGKADSEPSAYLLQELSIWTGWRVCQTREEFKADENSCAASWRAWLVAHAAEKPAQWQESAATARLADLRSGDPARQSWALRPWHRRGHEPALGAAHFAELAWILHDALLPNKLKREQADHFVELAQVYKCSTRCVLFPPPLAGRTLPPAPPTLAEGKPVMVALPTRPVDLAAQWQLPEVPAELKAKVAKGVKLLKRYSKECIAGQHWLHDDAGYSCYEQAEGLDAFKTDPMLAAHTLARGYLTAPQQWWPVFAWHAAEGDTIDHNDSVVFGLAQVANKPLLVEYLLASYQLGMQPGKKSKQAMDAGVKANILIQLAELTKVPLCGVTPWAKDGQDPCFGQWSAWWSANREKAAGSWEDQGQAMLRADLQSDDLARRYTALANLERGLDLSDSSDPGDVAVRWSLRDVLLNPATPAEVADAYDAKAADLHCNFRCIAYPPPLAGRNAPALTAMLAKAEKSREPRAPSPVAAVPDGASTAVLAKTCRQLLMRLEAEQALEVCGKGAAKDPKHAELQIALAWATLDARDAGAAVVAAHKAVAVAQGAGQAEAQLVLGAALTAAGEKPKAQAALTVAAANQATAAEAKARLAMLEGKAPAGWALPRLAQRVHCAGQAKSADPQALLLRRGWVAGLAAWQAAVKDVAVGPCKR